MNRFFAVTRFIVVTSAVLALRLLLTAQDPSAESLRQVQGQTIISNEVPRADLTFGKDFHYVGGQRVNLYGKADGEQHIFVAAKDRVAERFYWVQFEHMLPSNKEKYNYRPDRTTDIGGLLFIYDAKSWPDYAANEVEDPASDSAAIARLLDEHNLVFPKKTVRVRMFHLPTFDRRTELMIIYGEALPDDTKVPLRDDGVELDKDAPDVAHLFLEHARRDIGIQKK